MRGRQWSLVRPSFTTTAPTRLSQESIQQAALLASIFEPRSRRCSLAALPSGKLKVRLASMREVVFPPFHPGPALFLDSF